MAKQFPFNSALSHVFTWAFIEEIYCGVTKQSSNPDMAVIFKEIEI
jgi:hypothetical protein